MEMADSAQISIVFEAANESKDKDGESVHSLDTGRQLDPGIRKLSTPPGDGKDFDDGDNMKHDGASNPVPDLVLSGIEDETPPSSMGFAQHREPLSSSVDAGTDVDAQIMSMPHGLRCSRCSQVNIQYFCPRVPLSQGLWEHSEPKSLDPAYGIKTLPYPSLVIAPNANVLLNSAERGCGLCRCIWQALHIADIFPRCKDHEITLAANNGSILWYRSDGTVHTWPTLAITCKEVTHLVPREARFHAMPHADGLSDEVFTLARQWIRTCHERHGVCMRLPAVFTDRSFCPPRLIDVATTGSSQDTMIKLVPREEVADPSRVASVAYTALSYCWGGHIAEATTSMNLDARLQGFSSQDLPRTLRDAIYITRKLNIRYLWIDALCIVQSTAEATSRDWETHVNDMGSIYANAFCTLSAPDSAHSDQGMLNPRHYARFGYPAAKIPLAVDSLPTGYYTPQTMPTFNSAVEEGILGTRGWAYQERLLCSRRLCFTKFGLFWECGNATASETRPNGLDRSTDIGFFRNECHNAAALSTWHDRVTAFSKLNLAFESDRLPAIGSIAKAFHRTKRLGDEYLAGLWQSTLIQDLCWQSVVGKNAEKTFAAPSWSWASVSGSPVEYKQQLDTANEYGDITVNMTVLALLMETHIDVPSMPWYGLVKSGHILIEGMFRHVGETALTAESYQYGSENFLPDAGPKPPNFSLLAIGRTRETNTVIGLMLQKTESSESCYRRIGLCWNWKLEDDTEAVMTVVKIV